MSVEMPFRASGLDLMAAPRGAAADTEKIRARHRGPNRVCPSVPSAIWQLHLVRWPRRSTGHYLWSCDLRKNA